MLFFLCLYQNTSRINVQTTSLCTTKSSDSLTIWNQISSNPFAVFFSDDNYRNWLLDAIVDFNRLLPGYLSMDKVLKKLLQTLDVSLWKYSNFGQPTLVFYFSRFYQLVTTFELQINHIFEPYIMNFLSHTDLRTQINFKRYYRLKFQHASNPCNIINHRICIFPALVYPQFCVQFLVQLYLKLT